MLLTLGMTVPEGQTTDVPSADLDRRLGPTEVTMRRMAADPHRRNVGMVIWILDRTPDWAQLVETWERATRLIPRMRQHLVDPPLGGTYWVTDPNFDLRYHLKRVRVPEPGGLRQLLDMAAPIQMAPTDPARSPWEVILVEGLDGDRAALIQRGDHMVDGQGGMQMMEIICDPERNPAPKPMPAAPPPEDVAAIVRADLNHRLRYAPRSGWRAFNRVFGLAATAARGPRRTISGAADITASLRRNVSTIRAPKSPLLKQRSLSLHFEAMEIAVDDLRRAGKNVGGSLNDAFLTGVTGGIVRYHERHGVPIAVIPVGASISIRTPDDSMMTNKIGGTIVVVPADSDPLVRLASIREQVRVAREDKLTGAGESLAAVMTVLPVGLLSSATVGPDINTSNLPGPTDPLYIAGAQVQRLFGYAPLAGTAMIIGLVSILGVCCLGIDIDPAAIPDGEVLVECLRDAFQEVLDLGGENGGVTVPTLASEPADDAEPESESDREDGS